MSKNRNPYAQAHSLRGGAGSGAHRDRCQEIIDDFTDPYNQEWMDLCPRGNDLPTRASGPRVDNDVKNHLSASGPPPLSREFLLNRGYCCDMGCQNCPYKDPP